MSEKHIGEVVQVIGPVLDIRFAHDELPALLNAIEIESNGAKLTAEVAQQIGDDVVRCIAMNSTDGLVRGTKAVDTGGPITVPVGDACLGRVFNLLGDPVDNNQLRRRRSAGLSIVRLLLMRNRCRPQKFWKPVSKS